jgi:excisionase family DNA binding protein
MAKLFYTLNEASERLGKSEADVRELAQSGQLEEMRDGDQVMFKRQQVDLLAGDADQVDDFDLDFSSSGSSIGFSLSDSAADAPAQEPDVSSENEESSGGSGSGFGLSDSGTGLGLGGSGAGLDLGGSGFGFDLGDSGSAAGLDLSGDSNSDSGMGVVFEGGEDDDSAETRVADAVDEELLIESVGSGSGLLDLTRESDDTSLGAELLDEVWEDEESGEFGAAASGLFETSDAGLAEQAPSGAPMGLAVAYAEAYDGKWSGAGVGFLVGAMIALVAVSVMLTTSIMGVSPKLGAMVSGDLMIWGGGFAAFAIVSGLIGMFIGKASE